MGLSEFWIGKFYDILLFLVGLWKPNVFLLLHIPDFLKCNILPWNLWLTIKVNKFSTDTIPYLSVAINLHSI